MPTAAEVEQARVKASSYSPQSVPYQGGQYGGGGVTVGGTYPHLGVVGGQYVFTDPQGYVYTGSEQAAQSFVEHAGSPFMAEQLSARSKGATTEQFEAAKQAEAEAQLQARNAAYNAALQGNYAQVKALGLESTFAALKSGATRDTGVPTPSTPQQFQSYLSARGGVSGRETPLAAQYQSQDIMKAQERAYQQPTASEAPRSSPLVTAQATQEANVGWLMLGTGLPEATVRSQLLPKIGGAGATATYRGDLTLMTPAPPKPAYGGMSVAPPQPSAFMTMAPAKSVFTPTISVGTPPKELISQQAIVGETYFIPMSIGPLKFQVPIKGEQYNAMVAQQLTQYETAKAQAKLSAEAQSALAASPESGEYGRFIAKHPEMAAQLDITRASYLDLSRPEFGKRYLDIDEKVWGVSKQFENIASAMENPSVPSSVYGSAGLNLQLAPARAIMKASKSATEYVGGLEPPKGFKPLEWGVYGGAQAAGAIAGLPQLPSSFVRTGGQIGAGLAGEAEYFHRAQETGDYSKLTPALASQRTFFFENAPKAIVPIVTASTFLGAGGALTGVAAAKLPKTVKVLTYEPQPSTAEFSLEVGKVTRVGAKPPEIGTGGIAERPSTPIEGRFRMYAPEAPKIEASVVAKGKVTTPAEPRLFGRKTNLFPDEKAVDYVRADLGMTQPEKPSVSRTFEPNEEMLAAYKARGTVKTGGFIPQGQPAAFEAPAGLKLISETEISRLLKQTSMRLEKGGVPQPEPLLPVAPREITLTLGGEKPSQILGEVTPKISGPRGEHYIAKALTLETAKGKPSVTESVARYQDIARTNTGDLVLYTGEAQAKGGPIVKISAIVKSKGGGLADLAAMKPEDVFRAVPKPPKGGAFKDITVSGGERPLLPELGGPTFPKEPFKLAEPKDIPKMLTETKGEPKSFLKSMYGQTKGGEVSLQISKADEARLATQAKQALAPTITDIAAKQQAAIGGKGLSVSIGPEAQAAAKAVSYTGKTAMLGGWGGLAQRAVKEVRETSRQSSFQAPRGLQLPAGLQLPRGMQMPSEVQMPREVQIDKGVQIPKELQLPRDIQIPREVQIPRGVQIPKELQISRQAITQRELTATGFRPPSVPNIPPFTPTPPPPPPPTGGGGGFKFPSFGLPPEKERGRAPKGKGRATAYIPSFTAIQLNIRGAKGKTELTGFGLRPIIGSKRKGGKL